MKEHVLKQKSRRVVDIKQKKNNVSLTNINIMQRYINMRGKIYYNFMDFTKAYAKHFSIKDYAIPTLIWDYLKAEMRIISELINIIKIQVITFGIILREFVMFPLTINAI